MDDVELSKDFLTGFYTRQSLYPLMQKLQLDTQRYQSPFSILMIDLDHFKPYNDKYGHAKGDEILKYFSTSIRLSLVAEPTIQFRLGGDEFVILFPAKEANEVKRLISRINEDLRRTPYPMGGRPVKLGFSAGIVSYPAHEGTPSELLHYADEALYFSKRNGRGRVTQYGHFFNVKLERAARSFCILTLTFLTGYATGSLIQPHLNLEYKILGLIGKTKSVMTHLREESSHAMGSIRSLGYLVRPPEISAPSSQIKAPDLKFSSAPQVTAQDLVDLKSIQSFLVALPSVGRPEISTLSPPVKKPDPKLMSGPPTGGWDLVYMKSGGVIQCVILKEDEARLTLQLDISAEKGLMVVDKTDVLKIVKKTPVIDV